MKRSANNFHGYPILSLLMFEKGELQIYIYLIITTIWFLVTAYFVYQRRHDEFMAKRMPTANLVTIFCLLGFNYMIALHLNISMFTTRNAPIFCHTYIWTAHALVPIVLTTYSIRAAHILFTFALNQARLGNTDFGVAEGSRFERAVMRVSVRTVFRFFHHLLRIRQWLFHQKESNLARRVSGTNHSNPHTKSFTNLPTSHPVSSHLPSQTTAHSAKTGLIDMELVQQLNSIKNQDLICFYILVMIFSLIMCTVVFCCFYFVAGFPVYLQGAAVPSYSVTPQFCNLIYFAPIQLLASVLIAPVLLFMILIRRMPDPLLLRLELLLSLAPFAIGMALYMHDYWWQQSQISPVGCTVWLLGLGVAEMICTSMFPLIVNELRRQSQYKLLKVTHNETNPGKAIQLRSSATNDYVQFEAMLKDTKLYAQFKQICADAMVYENIMFYEEHNKFVAKYQTHAGEKCKRAAVDLFNSFLKDDAQNQLNIKATIINSIKKTLESESQCSVALFQPVRDEVMRMLYENNFIRNKELRKAAAGIEISA